MKRWEQLAGTCERDARAIQTMTSSEVLHVPGGGTTTDASLGKWLRDRERTRMARMEMPTRDGRRATSADARAPAARSTRNTRKRTAGQEEGHGESGESDVEDRARTRQRRGGSSTGTYDETPRRRKRRRDTADAQYVARSRQEQKITLKRGIEVGPRTTERIVRARYEWRDAGLAPVGAVKAGMWSELRTWDPGPW